MKAAFLPDRGVVKVAGDDARDFLHGLLSANILTLAPGAARFGALLSPQGKIIADFIVAAAPAEDGGGFFLDVPRALATAAGRQAQPLQTALPRHGRGPVRDSWRYGGLGWKRHGGVRP